MGNGSPEQHLLLAIADYLVCILIAAGWKGGIQQVHQTVMTKFSGRLAEVAKLAIQLNRAVAEETAPNDLEVICLDQGIRFDSARMDNAYGDGSPEKDGNKLECGEDILCTSELGLRKVTKLAESMESMEKWNEIILLKPKVVLLSELEVATKLSEMA